MKVTVSQAENG